MGVQFAHRIHSGFDCGVGLAICGSGGEEGREEGMDL